MKLSHRQLFAVACATSLLAGCKASYLTANEDTHAYESRDSFLYGKPPIATIAPGSKLEVVGCEYMKSYRALEVVTNDGNQVWVVKGKFDLELNRACDG